MIESREDGGGLEQAVAALSGELPRLNAAQAQEKLGWLRRRATTEGFASTALLAEGLSTAIAEDGSRVALSPWLEALTMAARCGRGNAEAGPLLLATVGVRFVA